MNINGHDNKADVIQNVIENIDDGLYSNAKDMLNQLKEIEVEGVDRSMAEEAFRNAGHKLPIKTKLVERRPM